MARIFIPDSLALISQEFNYAARLYLKVSTLEKKTEKWKKRYTSDHKISVKDFWNELYVCMSAHLCYKLILRFQKK